MHVFNMTIVIEETNDDEVPDLVLLKSSEADGAQAAYQLEKAALYLRKYYPSKPKEFAGQERMDFECAI